MTKDAGADKILYKPPGWIPWVYAPKHKIESESQMSTIPQDKLNSAYTLWVMVHDMQQGMFKTGTKKNAGYQDNLQEVTSFDTVSFLLLMIY